MPDNPDPLAAFIAEGRECLRLFDEFDRQDALEAKHHLARALDVIEAMLDALAERRAYAGAADMYTPVDDAIDDTCHKIEQAAREALEGRV